ncbi:GPI anchored protein, putative [Penicillium digitatum]|uniref:GPI anchored protein, putative n=3 Tax=Penicillium digitatum TaxID=36651 RepID=K9FGI0_PEND2|nr:GPI anchored protein, putative [Penicillium digitatum Pd1]EKV06622.1 GPI anchored protein, putative [Penicillium digitatum Pd1]EKV08304.1 GPI anchored protein, putative [Penicillium digitatum PHI26]KAG0159706.1 hypothetical protein PDIDSM_7229 [Penicillium digitatum]QQK40794.1 GPI anchored protein, putative [Penicillium digitatum]
MILQALLAIATLGIAAEYPVVSLFIPNADPQSLLGEVLAAQSATTTYSINCPVGKTNSTECGMGPGLFLTAAPTSVEYLISDESDNLYDHVVCDVTDLPTGAYTCTDTITGKGINTPGTSTSTIGWDQITLLLVTITSTADAVAATANGTTSEDSTGSKASATVITTPAAGVAAAATTSTIATTPAAGVAGRPSPTTAVLGCILIQALAAMLL